MSGIAVRYVYLSNEELLREAEELTERLNASLCGQEKIILTEEQPGDELYLRLGTDGLSLVQGDLCEQGDFTKMLIRLKHNNLSHEMLVKASKFKNLEGPFTAVDATAGMGEDALLLAAAGYHVKLYEYNPIIAALLADTLRRAALCPELAETAGRMELHYENSLRALPNLEEAPDVIVLDPMFPLRQKSALIKKKFQLLQQLEMPCVEEKELLDAAMAANPRRIVIKRPLKGPLLAGVKPSYSLEGKAIRYDCIVLRT